MPRHQHRALPGYSKNYGWTACVTPRECAAKPQRQAAHGGILRLDICRCGAARYTEINGRHRNYGPWEGDAE